MNSAINIILILNIVAHVMLLGFAIFRRKRLKTGVYWLPATIVTLLVATATLMIPQSISFGVSTLALIVMLTVFCGMVSIDLNQNRVRLF
ncbi:MAG: hypothetical protein AAF787_06680, partial [Chloroflexota bacterium]